jgi:hypothetical protein
MKEVKGQTFLFSAIVIFTVLLFTISSFVIFKNAKDYYVNYKKEELVNIAEKIVIMRNKYDSELFLDIIRIIGNEVVITNGRQPIFNNLSSNDIYECVKENQRVYISDIIKCADKKYVVFTKKTNTEWVILLTEYNFSFLEVVKLSTIEIIITTFLIFIIMLMFTFSVTQTFVVPLDKLACLVKHGKNEKFKIGSIVEEINIVVDHINTTNDANNKLRQVLIQSNILSIERNNLLNAALKTELLKK